MKNIGILGLFLLSSFISDSRADTNCVRPPPGLVSWWPAEGNANDAAGTNAGVLMNGTTFVPGLVGQAFYLSGASAFIQVADAPNLRFTNAMTVEAWISNNVPLGSFGAIVTKWDGGNNQRSYSLAIQPSGKVALGLNSDGGNANIGNAFSLDPVPTNQWIHVCATYDGASIKMYINGVLQNATPWTNGIFPGSVPLSIGSALVAGAFFRGLIDEVSLYNRALTFAEIQDIYNIGQGGKCPAPAPPVIKTQPQGKVGYWGGTVSFQLTLKPNALPLSYQWFVDGFPISWATKSTLTLTNLELSDGGHFQVVVTNSLGSVTSNPALLIVNPAGVSLALTPTLVITGTVGKNFGIQYANSVSDTNNWITLTNITLSQPVQLWFDTSVDVSNGNHPRRFYRVVAVP